MGGPAGWGTSPPLEPSRQTSRGGKQAVFQLRDEVSHLGGLGGFASVSTFVPQRSRTVLMPQNYKNLMLLEVSLAELSMYYRYCCVMTHGSSQV